MKIHNNDNYQLFQNILNSKEGSSRYAEYIKFLGGPIEDFPDSLYCGRRSRIYHLNAEQLREYFKNPGGDIKELKSTLREWHEKNFNLVEVTSVVFHVYRRSESDIEEVGQLVYYPKDYQHISAAAPSLQMSTKVLFNDNDEKPVALPADLLIHSLENGIDDHITAKIKKLVRELGDEYTKWKLRPSATQPPSTIVLLGDQGVRNNPDGSARGNKVLTKDVKEIPPWIDPTISRLCKELEAPAAVPHTLAGVKTILTQPCPNNQKEIKTDKLPAMIIAVYFFVSTKLSGRETTGKEYGGQREVILNTLARLEEELRKEIQDTGWEGWEKVGSKDVDTWLMDISTDGWLKRDWFQNIIEGAGLAEVTKPDRHFITRSAKQSA